jgi:23S rRNA (uracil1939-C5)-methyltransferase
MTRRTSSIRPGDRLAIAATDLDAEGAGVGVTETGVAVHVPGLWPGETAQVVVEHRSPHRPVAWARLARLEHAAPGRVRRPGERGHLCGGCLWSIQSYPAQVAVKAARVARLAEALREAGAGPVRLGAFVPSPRETGYRSRGKFVVERLRGGPVLGAYRPRSHEVVRTVPCLVHEPAVARAARALERVIREVDRPEGSLPIHAGGLRYASVRANHAGEVLVTLVVGEDARPWADLAARLAAREPALVGVALDVNPDPGNVLFSGVTQALRGRVDLDERYGEVAVRLTGHGFGQANREVATRLYAHAADAALSPLAGGRPGLLWDLFSGAGALTLTLAHQAAARTARLVGVEQDRDAVTRATAAAGRAGLGERVRFEVGDAHLALAPGGASPGPDVVVLDPPRTGCRPALLAALVGRRIPRVVYVSCDPGTLARDLDALHRNGYAVETLTGFDMLPQTPDVELLAGLAFRA